MRGNQAIEVVAGWACFNSRDEILKLPWKYIRSQSCVGVVRNVRLSSKPTFNVAARDTVADRESIVTWFTTLIARSLCVVNRVVGADLSTVKLSFGDC